MSSPRETCGTRWGIRDHAHAGEPLCGLCTNLTDAALVAHEARQPVPQRAVYDDLQQVIHVLAKALAADQRAKRELARRMREAA